MSEIEWNAWLSGFCWGVITVTGSFLLGMLIVGWIQREQPR